MSYILEALKKSEQERRLGHVPDISVSQESAPRAPQRWQRWLLAALLLNVLVLAIVAWRPWARTAAPPPAPDVARHSEVPAATITEPPAPPAPVQEAAPLPPPVTTVPLAPPPAATAAIPEPTPGEPPAALPADAPRWQDLPPEQRDLLPVPRIDVHVFAREPARRFVLIDLRKYHEGERLDSGVTIEAIRNDGIVLSYQGQRYRVDRP